MRRWEAARPNRLQAVVAQRFVLVYSSFFPEIPDGIRKFERARLERSPYILGTVVHSKLASLVILPFFSIANIILYVSAVVDHYVHRWSCLSVAINAASSYYHSWVVLTINNSEGNKHTAAINSEGIFLVILVYRGSMLVSFVFYARYSSMGILKPTPGIRYYFGQGKSGYEQRFCTIGGT